MALFSWIASPAQAKFTTVPLVFALGSLTLVFKGVYLLRRSSEGLGLTHTALVAPSGAASLQKVPSVNNQAAQILQDFGAGPLLLTPLLNLGKHIDKSWANAPHLSVFVAGATLFLLGWILRRLTSPKSES